WPSSSTSTSATARRPSECPLGWHYACRLEHSVRKTIFVLSRTPCRSCGAPQIERLDRPRRASRLYRRCGALSCHQTKGTCHTQEYDRRKGEEVEPHDEENQSGAANHNRAAWNRLRHDNACAHQRANCQKHTHKLR